MAAIRVSAPPRSALVLVGAGLAANAAAAGLATRSAGTVAAVALLASVVVLSFVRPGIVLWATGVGLVASADLLDVFVSMPRMSVAGFELGLSDLFLGATLLGWAGWELRRREAAAAPLSALAREPAFAMFVALMGLAAYDLARGGYGTFSSGRIFGYCILVPVVVRVVERPRHLRLLGLSLAAGAVVSSLGAVAMVAAGRNVTEHGLSTGGLRGLSIGGSLLVAGALLFVLAAVVGEMWPAHVLIAALVLVLVGGVAASGARETWVGVVAALALYTLLSSLRGAMRLALVFGLAGVLAGGVYTIVPHQPRLDATISAVESRLTSVDPAAAASDPSVQVRYDKWRVVWDQMKAHPFLGTGFGYPATYTSNIGGNNFVRSYVDDPENTQLWLWARMGTIGFAVWVAFNLLVLATLVVRFVRSRAPVARVAALWGAGVLPVIWSAMTFSPVSAFASTLLLYWLAVSLAPVAGRLAATSAS